MPIEILGAILILAGIAPPWFLVRRGASPTAPLVLIWISQTVPPGITLLNLTGDVTPFRSTTWIVLTGSFATILLGWLVGIFLTRGRIPTASTSISPSRLGIAVSLLTFAYGASIAQGIVRAGGFPLLSASPEAARFAFMTGRIQNILFAAGIPLFIVAIHYLRISSQVWKKIAMVLVLCFLVGSYLLIGSRFMTLVWLSMALVYWDQHVGRLRLGRIAVVVCVFVLVFVLIGYFRYGKLVATAFGSSKVMTIGVILAFQSVYSYIGNAYWNLDNALHRYSLDQLDLPTWGVSSNEGFLWVIGAVPGLQKAYGWSNALNFDVMLKEGLNATTYHWTLFKDFGVAGPLVGSFLVGLTFTHFHRRRCRTHDAGGAMVYGLASYFVLGSFNLLPTVIPTPLFGMMILLLTVYVCSVPSPLPSPQQPSRSEG